MNNTFCDKCESWFILDEFRMGVIKRDGLTVQYFSCPNCGAKYHVFTADAQMRELVQQRKAVQMTIKAAHAKRFRQKTIRKYEQELEQIKKKQEAIRPALNARGEKVLRETEQTAVIRKDEGNGPTDRTREKGPGLL